MSPLASGESADEKSAGDKQLDGVEAVSTTSHPRTITSVAAWSDDLEGPGDLKDDDEP